MTHKSNHRGVEFFSESADHSDVHAWYDNLRANEVKASIVTVKCKEYRPYDEASFRMIVLCKHPFSRPEKRNKTNSHSDNNAPNEPSVEGLMASFTDWIEQHDVPKEAVLGDRSTFIEWWPMEMIPCVVGELSPPDQAQLEMNNHFLDCLELIRLAVISDRDFQKLWNSSNEPFFAAGRLIYGEFQWVEYVPVDLFREEKNARLVLERVAERSREYVGLIRLSLLTDAESVLLDRVGLILRRFKTEHASKTATWIELAQEFLDNENELPDPSTFANPDLYEEIDAVCDHLRLDLADATIGLEDEIILLINAILPTLEKPKSSLLFSDEADRWH